jgi:hypothetical protein
MARRAMRYSMAVDGDGWGCQATLVDGKITLVILRYATRQGFSYEWSHHQRPAKLAGI